MYPVSAAYKTAIAQNVRNTKISGTITLIDDTIINITDEDIALGSLYLTEQCVAGEDIEIGNVYASELGFTLKSPPENPYSLDGARVLINFGIDVGGGVFEYVPLGYFYVTEIQRKANNVNLTALDGMLLFDIPVGDLGSSSPRNFIVHACQRAGVTLGTSVFEIDTFANAGVLLAAPDASKIKTCRDLLMWACQIMGAFARMNRSGELEIVPIKARPSVKTINKAERFNSDVSDFAVKITKVSMQVGETVYSRGTDGMTMVLEENPLMTGLSESQINAVLDNLLAQITTAVYVPFNSNFIGDPALQPGDFVTLSDTSVLGGGDVASIITHSTWRYRGPHNIKGAGKHGLVRGVQNQQMKAVSSIVAIARAAQDLALAANQSTQLIKDAIGGHVLIRQNPDETNEILIMDNPDPDQAVKIWRWNMGGLGYSDNCVGADNPDREYEIAMTMDGAINANFIKTGQLDAGVVRIGPQTTFAEGFLPALMKVQGITPGMDADEDCTALYHFDGSLAPAIGPNPTFTRNSPAYLSNGTQVAEGVPRYENCRFGKGYFAEKGTTNLCPNPSVETNLDGWVGAYRCTIDRDNTYARYGSWSAKITTRVPGANFYASIGGSNRIPVSDNTQYALSCDVRPYAGHSIAVRLQVVFWRSDGTYISEINVSTWSVMGSGVWERLSGTFTTPADTAFVEIRLRGSSSTGDGVIVHVDGVQLEQRSSASSFVEGTRAPEVLAIPTSGVFQKGNWSIHLLFKPIVAPQGQDTIWQLFIDSSNFYTLIFDDSTKYLVLWIVSSGVSYTIAYASLLEAGSIYQIVATGDGTNLCLYINGEQIGKVPYVEPVGTLPEYMYIGSHASGTLQADGVYDELRIDKIARTDEEIRGWYTANAPFWVKADLDELPGYLKLEPDGIKVYDPNDALRVLLGSWLSDAVRKYGLKIIGGEIYATKIQSGEEGATSYIKIGTSFEPLEIVEEGKTALTIWSYGGGMIQFYDTNLNDMAGQILPMRDAFGQGIRVQGRNNTGQARDIGLDGRDIRIQGTQNVSLQAVSGSIEISSGPGRYILLIGDTSVNGSFNVYGQKNCIQVTENFGLRTLSAVESPDVLYYDRGVVNLQNGEATIYIDPIFLECIEPDTELTPWQIWVQCYGENDVYVSEIGKNYFKIKEKNGGKSNNKVIWRLEATRKNYAGIRLMEVTN